MACPLRRNEPRSATMSIDLAIGRSQRPASHGGRHPRRHDPRHVRSTSPAVSDRERSTEVAGLVQRILASVGLNRCQSTNGWRSRCEEWGNDWQSCTRGHEGMDDPIRNLYRDGRSRPVIPDALFAPVKRWSFWTSSACLVGPSMPWLLVLLPIRLW